MSMKFGIALPQGTLMELAGITDPVEAYETMTQVALTAEEVVGFDSLWLSDAFWPAVRIVSTPSSDRPWESCSPGMCASARPNGM